MTLDKWMVLGVAAIAWLNWHFLAAVRRTAALSDVSVIGNSLRLRRFRSTAGRRVP